MFRFTFEPDIQILVPFVMRKACVAFLDGFHYEVHWHGILLPTRDLQSADIFSGRGVFLGKTCYVSNIAIEIRNANIAIV